MALDTALKSALLDFLNKNKNVGISTFYMFYLHKAYDLHPVLVPSKKRIYQSQKEAIERLKESGGLCQKAELRYFEELPQANNETEKIH